MRISLLLLLLWPGIAGAASMPELEQRLRSLEDDKKSVRQELDAVKVDYKKLKREHEALKGQQEDTKQKVDGLLPMAAKFFGYVDFGLFYVQGNGSGIRPDVGHSIYPQYSDVAGGWVFYGDPLSTAINSRGEPASTDGSRAVTFDGVNNGGKLSFIANAFNFGLFTSIGENFTLNASIDFIPRGRDVSKPGIALGDFIDFKLGYGEYTLPWEKADIRVYIGKFDSVLGVEYRSQQSPERLTVTPSLICRYTCGRPLGVKIRGRFFDEAFVVNLAVTNGSNFVENFGFSNEIDTNFFKTGSLRLSYTFPVGAGLEIGVSGAAGAQDYQRADNVFQWHAGADIKLQIGDLEVSGEYVIGRALGANSADGTQCGDAPCLRYQGAYGLVGYKVLNWLEPYFRVDWRDALHRDGVSFVYVSKVLRFTGGLHFDINQYFIVKAEYTHIQELGGQPQFDNDVATSAFVFKY